jgi:methyl-accepting chemotaxis protein
MRFRTKIWMLPLSAAVVFILGVVVSFVVGLRTESRLAHLHAVDGPLLDQLMKLDRSVEEFRLTLQSAASEGDAGKLAETERMVKLSREALTAIGRIEGQAALSQNLNRDTEAYFAAGTAAVKAMLGKGDAVEDPGAMVTRMQTTQATLDTLLHGQEKQARSNIEEAQEGSAAGVRLSLIVTMVTGLVVLAVLGLASRLVLASVWKDLGGEPDEVRRLVSQVAEGDLSVQVDTRNADRDSLMAAVAGMVERMRSTVSVIRQSTDAIATASTEIASGNQDLSHRTEHTASNLQQAASSMEELTSAVQQSADSAQQANQLATQAAQAAQRGGEIVQQVVSSMGEINVGSRKINEIIGVIDGIAFQTNILALNAAVEAARAGEQGRGFAVVAGEVRTLAQRSAQAAKEIKSLINASSEKVESGARLVEDAGSAMQEIVSGVQRVTDIIGEITSATGEQSTGISNVNGTVSQLDQMTQQNAALVEQSAAAAESLRAQSGRLTEAVAAFRLPGGA